MVCQTWPEFSTLNSLHKFWQIKQWQEKIKPAPEYWINLHSNFQLDFLFDWLAHPLFFFLWYSHGKEIMAKGPLHETNQPAKSHKNVEGILQSNYEETVSVGTERRPDQLRVCVGCARVPPQAESIGVQQGRFYLDRGSPNQASESDLSQEKVAELQAEPAGRWLKGRPFPWFQWPQEVFGSWVHCNDSCPTPGPSQSSEVLSAAAGPRLHSLLLLSEHCHRPALLPNILWFSFHVDSVIPWFTSLAWPLVWEGWGEPLASAPLQMHIMRGCSASGSSRQHTLCWNSCLKQRNTLCSATNTFVPRAGAAIPQFPAWFPPHSRPLCHQLCPELRPQTPAPQRSGAESTALSLILASPTKSKNCSSSVTIQGRTTP